MWNTCKQEIWDSIQVGWRILGGAAGRSSDLKQVISMAKNSNNDRALESNTSQ